MAIIKYRVFKSSEEFEVWQQDNQDVSVANVIPIANSFSGDVGENDSISIDAMWGIFVTYVV